MKRKTTLCAVFFIFVITGGAFAEHNGGDMLLGIQAGASVGSFIDGGIGIIYTYYSSEMFSFETGISFYLNYFNFENGYYNSDGVQIPFSVHLNLKRFYLGTGFLLNIPLATSQTQPAADGEGGLWGETETRYKDASGAAHFSFTADLGIDLLKDNGPKMFLRFSQLLFSFSDDAYPKFAASIGFIFQMHWRLNRH